MGEKYKDVDMSDESSSEEEDDFGVLVTEDVEAGIGQVLDAIRMIPACCSIAIANFSPT